MSARALVGATVAIVMLLLVGPAAADETAPPVASSAPPARATFALVVGSNQSVDAELAPLKYADDDAARFFDLFRLLGARTYLLARLDDNTRRLHPQAAAEASEPRRAQLDRAVTQLAADVAQATARNVQTVVYLVYAGHGNVKAGQGYLTLEDARVTGADLAEIVRRIPATRIHVIADACASYYLAHARGPGGQRRPLAGFRASALADDPRVGLLLSTSSARESHEWDAFQAGVFSHEVRSGLYGGADADGDGVVSYSEIAAFVARASSGVPNDKYRPEVYARAPRASETLLEIGRAQTRRLVIEGQHAGRYFVEDSRGVRLADVHSAPGHTLQLLRPPPAAGRLYLRRVDKDEEFVVEPAREVVTVAELTPREPTTQSRGAEHEAFALLFALPFDEGVVAEYRSTPPLPESAPASDTAAREAAPGLRRTLGLAAIGVAAAGVGAGTYFALSAQSTVDETTSAISNAEAAERADRVSGQRTAAIASFAVGGAAAAAAAILWLWPHAHGVHAIATPSGGFVGYGTSFF